ncbi:MAG: DUF58 domain-containing protein, partial [Nitrospiraceae bacterium]
SSALLSYPLLLKRRGYHCLDGIKVVTRFPFGLFLKGAYYAGESQILVYPELKHVPDAVIQNLAVQGHEQPLSRRGPGTDLYNLRLYHPGDDSRTIHWMTTARTAQLMIRETEAEDQRRITLALSTIAPVSYEECFERGVTLAASLVAYFHERGYAIRALVGPQDIPLRWDEEHVRSILRALALCERVSPSNDDSIAAAFHSLRQDDQADACTIAILPWPDVQLVTMCQGFQHLIHVAEDKEYLDAARPGVPA